MYISSADYDFDFFGVLFFFKFNTNPDSKEFKAIPEKKKQNTYTLSKSNK